MNKYEEEMFAYLTKSDNYQSAKEISILVSKIDERLKKEFWDEVVSRTKDTIVERIANFGISKWKGNPDFIINKGNGFWKFFVIGTDMKTYIGIYTKESNEFEGKIKHIIDKNKSLIGNENEIHWHGWKYFDHVDDEDEIERNLIRLLPDVREKFIEEYVGEISSEIILYIENIAPICDEINKAVKKS